MKINQIIINELSEGAQPGVATPTAQTPQAQAAAQAIQKGLEKLQQQSPGLDHSFNTTTAIQEILPDGTVVMDSNLQPSALQNVRKILALGGGANFKVSMSHQGIPSASGQSLAPPAQPQPGVAEGDKKPYPKTWHDVDPKLGKQVDKMSQAEKVKKGLAHPDTLKKQGVAEGNRPFRGVGGAFNRGDDERHDLDPTDWYIVKDGEMFSASIYPRQVQQAIAQGFSRTRAQAQSRADSQGVAEGHDSEDLANEVYAEFERTYPNLARRADERTIHAAIMDVLNYGGDNNPGALAQDVARAVKHDMQQGVAEAGNANSGRRGPDYQDNSPAIPGRVEPLPQGLKHHADASRYGGTEPNDEDDRLLGPAQRHRLHQAVTPDDWFDESQEKIAGRHDPDDFDNMVGRLKQLAGAGPLKTVWDPARRVYRNVPHAVQPPQQPKKATQ